MGFSKPTFFRVGKEVGFFIALLTLNPIGPVMSAALFGGGRPFLFEGPDGLLRGLS